MLCSCEIKTSLVLEDSYGSNKYCVNVFYHTEFEIYCEHPSKLDHGQSYNIGR